MSELTCTRTQILSALMTAVKTNYSRSTKALPNLKTRFTTWRTFKTSRERCSFSYWIRGRSHRIRTLQKTSKRRLRLRHYRPIDNSKGTWSESQDRQDGRPPSCKDSRLQNLQPCLPSFWKTWGDKGIYTGQDGKNHHAQKSKAEPSFFPAANGLALSSERPLLDAGSHGLA